MWTSLGAIFLLPQSPKLFVKKWFSSLYVKELYFSVEKLYFSGNFPIALFLIFLNIFKLTICKQCLRFEI